jgi:hypothetical protein
LIAAVRDGLIAGTTNSSIVTCRRSSPFLVVQRVTGNLLGELVLRCFDEVNQGSGRVDGRLFVGGGSESGSERGSELRLEFLVDLNCNRGIFTDNQAGGKELAVGIEWKQIVKYQ